MSNTEDRWRFYNPPIIDRLFSEAKFPIVRDAHVYLIPYRAKVLHAPDGDRVKVSIPCARRSWWLCFPMFLLLVWPPFMVWGFALAWVYNYRTGEVSFLPFHLAFFIVILGVMSVALFKFCFPRVPFEGTQECVTIGGYRFDWEETDGLRLGYSVGGKDFEEKQGRWHGLRMSYGEWGFDLPYMAPNYLAAAYVVWINTMLSTVGREPETVLNNPEEGFLKELY